MTPERAAFAIRALLESRGMLARTWEQYGKGISAHDAAQLVAEQAKCTFRIAARAALRAMPELGSTFWELLPCEFELQDRTVRL